MYKMIGIALLGLSLSACASEQLNHNTIEIASTVDTIYARQTLNNLSKFVDQPHAIPSQMQLAGGVFQTANTVNPSASLPLFSQVAKTAQLASSSGLTLSDASTLAGGGVTLSGSNTAQQNYTVAPNVDGIALRNQQALYRYAIYPEADLLAEYHPPRVFIKDSFHLDPFYLEEPHCVLCSNNQQKFDSKSYAPALHVNKLLKKAWLVPDPKSPDGLVFLGHFANHDLFMTRADYESGVLEDFILFTLNYVEPTEVFSQGSPEKVVPIVLQLPEPTETHNRKTTERPKARMKTFFVPAPSSGGTSVPATNYKIAPVTPFNLIIPQQIQPQ